MEEVYHREMYYPTPIPAFYLTFHVSQMLLNEHIFSRNVPLITMADTSETKPK